MGVIGAGLVVHGTVRGKGALRIDGVLDGLLELDGDVAVGPDGTVIAPVHARSVEIEGEIAGDVTASDGVTIRASGLLTGDVRARRIAIDDGGALHGGIEMEFDVAESREDAP